MGFYNGSGGDSDWLSCILVQHLCFDCLLASLCTRVFLEQNTILALKDLISPAGERSRVEEV